MAGKEAENIIKALEWTPLHVATYNQVLKDVESLCQTILLMRIKGLMGDIKKLVEQTDIFGLIPLHIAAAGGNYTILDKLIANRADVKCQDKNGWTPLNFAVLLHIKGTAITWDRRAEMDADKAFIKPLQ